MITSVTRGDFPSSVIVCDQAEFHWHSSVSQLAQGHYKEEISLKVVRLRNTFDPQLLASAALCTTRETASARLFSICSRIVVHPVY
uniref:DUF1508 domain-containing protein n=1 Tax=Heterorhabditis bacteriophora TaxID=37862 RepID=A0A1I7X9L0_HETBA